MIQERTPRKREFDNLRQDTRLDKSSYSTRSPYKLTVSPSPLKEGGRMGMTTGVKTPTRREYGNGDYSTNSKSPLRRSGKMNENVSGFECSPARMRTDGNSRIDANIKQYYNPHQTSTQNNNTFSPAPSPHKPHSKTPTKPPTYHQTLHKSSQKLKPNEYCTDCTNKILINHRKQ